MAYESRVQQAPLIQKLFSSPDSAAAYGADAAKNLQQAGAQLEQSVDELERDQYNQQRQEYNLQRIKLREADARAKSLFVQYKQIGNNALYNPDDGYISRKGEAAFGSYKQLPELMKQTKEGLLKDADADTINAFNMHAGNYDANAFKTVGKHEAGERNNYVDGSNQALIQSELDDVQYDPDPSKLPMRKKAIVEAHQQIAKLKGLDKATFNQNALNDIDNLYEATAKAKGNNESPLSALEFLESNKDDMTPAKYNQLKTSYTKAQEGLVSKANAKVGDINQRSKQGFTVPLEDIAEAEELAAKTNDATMLQSVQTAALNNERMMQMDKLPLPELQNIIQSDLQPATIANGANENEILLYEGAKNKLAANRKIAKDDSVTLAEMQGYALLPPTEPKYLQTNAEIMQGFAQKNGLSSYKLLKPNKRATLYDNIVKSESPKQILENIYTFSENSGKYFPSYMREITADKNDNLSNVVTRVGEMVQFLPNATQIASDAIAGAKMMQTQGAKAIAGGRAEAENAFNTYAGDMFKYLKPVAKQRIFETSLALYARGTAGQDSFNKEAFQTSINQAFGGSAEAKYTKANINEQDFLLPTGMSASQANNIWNNLTVQDFDETDLPLDYLGNRMSLNEIIDNAKLYAVGANKYKLFYEDGFLQGNNGEDFNFSFKERK